MYPFLRALKPYKGGNDLLWTLNKISIRDKHLTIIPMGNTATTNLFSIESHSGYFSAPLKHVWDRSKNEIELFTASIGGELKYKYDFSLTIAFDDFEFIGEIARNSVES
jgi:hypothetical protein